MTEHIRHSANSETYIIDPKAGETPAQLSPQILGMVINSIINTYNTRVPVDKRPLHTLNVSPEPRGEQVAVTLSFKRP